jgi:hypothetical protein
MLESAVVFLELSASIRTLSQFVPTSVSTIALLPELAYYWGHGPCRKLDPKLIVAETRIARLHGMLGLTSVLVCERSYQGFSLWFV